MTATLGARSDDGRWVWNGYEWRPYGFPPPPQRVKSWHPMIGRKAWSPLLLALTAGWLIVLGVWMPILIVVAHRIGPDGTISRTQGGAILAALGLAGTATLVLGAHLGWVRKPWQLLAESMLGTTVLLAWYVLAMAASSDPGADDAAGVGVIILTVPTWVLVFLLLVVGAGAGAVARLPRLRRERRT